MIEEGLTVKGVFAKGSGHSIDVMIIPYPLNTGTIKGESVVWYEEAEEYFGIKMYELCIIDGTRMNLTAYPEDGYVFREWAVIEIDDFLPIAEALESGEEPPELPNDCNKYVLGNNSRLSKHVDFEEFIYELHDAGINVLSNDFLIIPFFDAKVPKEPAKSGTIDHWATFYSTGKVTGNVKPLLYSSRDKEVTAEIDLTLTSEHEQEIDTDIHLYETENNAKLCELLALKVEMCIRDRDNLIDRRRTVYGNHGSNAVSKLCRYCLRWRSE